MLTAVHAQTPFLLTPLRGRAQAPTLSLSLVAISAAMAASSPLSFALQILAARAPPCP
jgi:broad specificity phosphatase PhoE